MLAGCTQEELQQAQEMADEAGKNDEVTPGEEGATETTDSGDSEEPFDIEEGIGLVTVESDDSFDATVSRISSAIEGNDALTLIGTVDHAANAQSADMELPPTTLLIFGNPKLGTPLMGASRSVAIDLPQKMLVWKEEGEVMVSYNDPQYLAARHGIEDEDEILAKIAGALEKLATGSASS
ncbi:hypothetical protein BRC86_02520 [Halobacteriales archaeon QS_3_64_16]|nr:MAG: hypothetical protein BRC86_02520 [Halobacteriales archaeon QS_3_64_16]